MIRQLIRSAAAAAWLALFAAAPVAADSTITLSGEELRLIAENPALLRLGEQDPGSLRQVLDRLQALAPASKGITDIFKAPDDSALPPEDRALIAQNPVLARTLRDSPEAALDLIRLIKQAAQGK
jgi:hypothetical protein